MKRLIFILLISLFLTASCGINESKTQSETKITESTSDIVTDHPETEIDTHTQTQALTESALGTVTSPIAPAEQILAEMTLEEKVGQLFLARNPQSEDEGIDTIKERHVGGIIFFARDFRHSSPEKFRAMIDNYNENANIPLLTAVDEEGGTVCRASLYSSFREEKFASPSELYTEGGLERILSDAAEKSEFLLDLGLNFNLAPVADISTDEEDFIFSRALGLGKKETAEYVSEVVKVMEKKGILSALKHFPGYGNNEDTHTGIAYDKRSLESIRENDLIPFEAGIRAGTPAVMVSHNIVESIDPSLPASLSEKVMEILRSEMDFHGIIMTDDLSMDAIENFTESGEAAVLAILAGADLLCCSDIERQHEAVLEAVRNGRISEERLNESVLRIINMKLRYKILS
ncbi:MAG: beta-hexosaminidase [Clostridia bacterium]|nr:beta-hexosaminidase [Clostridia bacterium]